jgi:hypothetical protein
MLLARCVVDGNERGVDVAVAETRRRLFDFTLQEYTSGATRLAARGQRCRSMEIRPRIFSMCVSSRAFVNLT